MLSSNYSIIFQMNVSKMSEARFLPILITQNDSPNDNEQLFPSFHLPFVIYWCSNIFQASITFNVRFYHRSERFDTLSKLIFVIWIFAPGFTPCSSLLLSIMCSSTWFSSQSALFNNQLQWKKFNIWDQFIVGTFGAMKV